MKLKLIFSLLFVNVISKPCDPVYCTDNDEELGLTGNKAPDEDCNPIFENCNYCMTANEINDEVFIPRQAVQPVQLCESTEQSQCSDFADFGFVCANSWNCRNNTIITDGKGLFDVRQASVEEEENQCGINSGTFDVTDKLCPDRDQICCQGPNFKITKCKEEISKTPKSQIQNYAQCGRNSSGALIFTGEDKDNARSSKSVVEAQPGEFPHMCVIFEESPSGYKPYVGGAALIARNKVITVAHKFYQTNLKPNTDLRPHVDRIYVRCGEYDVSDPSIGFPHQESKVKELIIHPDYSPKNIHFNMAILVTELNFVYKAHIGPVCLPRPDQAFNGQTNCWSSGFGSDQAQFGFYSKTLKKVDMPIVSPSECRRRFVRNNLSTKRLHPSWLCVGGEEGKDTCKGDGGSPHVCINDNKYTLVGSVSHGEGCGTEIPASYSNIAGSMCWVDWVMSTVPLADYNVDYVEDTLTLGLRDFDDNIPKQEGSRFKSVNGFSDEECKEFRRTHGYLFRDADIVYAEVDDRSASESMITDTQEQDTVDTVDYEEDIISSDIFGDAVPLFDY